MFLEAQFGADNVSPISEPKLPPLQKAADKVKGENDGNDSDASMDLSDDEEEERLKKLREKTEIERLHKIGIPVPGIRIQVDKMEAKVWLENLEIECGHRVFADRVRAVVERAVEVTAPLWG